MQGVVALPATLDNVVVEKEREFGEVGVVVETSAACGNHR